MLHQSPQLTERCTEEPLHPNINPAMILCKIGGRLKFNQKQNVTNLKAKMYCEKTNNENFEHRLSYIRAFLS